MSNTLVTITGNLTGDPELREYDNARKTVIRVASTASVRDRTTGDFRNGSTSFYNVSCWNALGENVLKSMQKGDPVVVTGRLEISTYQAQDGSPRQSAEINASNVGHDLKFGTTSFERPSRPEQAAA